MLPRTLVVLAVLASLGSVAGCGDDGPPDEPTPISEMAPTATVAPPFDARLEPAEAVLSLVPVTATSVAVTDFDTVRVQLGVPDLTGESPAADRQEFWARANREAVLLSGGMLRGDESELADYGFTQDDVDWEAHFIGSEGEGFVLGFRPDLPMAGVARAVRAGAGPLDGARVHAADHLVVSGTAAEDEQVWANEPVWDGLAGEPAGATYVRRGCVPVEDALGDGDDTAHLAQLAEAHPLSILDDVPAFSVAFGDHLATVRMEPNRADLFNRLDVGRDWPDGDFPETFRRPVADPTSGRIGYDVPRPPLAAAMTLGEELPFAICPEPPG
jgi:hypothetical protein